MRRRPVLLSAALGSLCACSQAPPPGAPAARVAWDRGLVPSAQLGGAQAARGLRVARGIIHLHSTYSHDACDNDPRPGGMANAPCAAHLRQGLCQTRQDFAMLTDHATHMAAAPWESLFLIEAGDEPVREREGGAIIGARLRCTERDGAAGHEVVVLVGGENALMPVGLTRHLGDSQEERRGNMTADDGEAVRRFRAAGAVVLQAHGESRTREKLRALAEAGLGGMEIYNLHANVDPRIRSEWLGLDGLGAAAGIVPWLAATPMSEGGPEPDLAALGFLDENRRQLGHYDALLGEGLRLSAMMGSDIHENTFKQPMADGERGDSYRRLMRWFGNHLLVPAGGPLDPQALREALAAGRAYGVFELFGPPIGFDFHAPGAGPGGAGELGGQAPEEVTLTLRAPTLGLPEGAADPPELELRLLRIAPGAQMAVEVAQKRARLDPRQPPELRVQAPGPGAYRAEIRIVPHHLLHLAGEGAEKYRRSYPYLYTNPIYVRQ